MRLARRRELTRRRQLGSYYDPYYRVSRYNIKPFKLVPPLGRVLTNRKDKVETKASLPAKRVRVVARGSAIPDRKPNVVNGYITRYVKRQVRKIVPGRYIPDCSKKRTYRKGMMKKLAAQIRKVSGQGALAKWRGKLIRKILC